MFHTNLDYVNESQLLNENGIIICFDFLPNFVQLKSSVNNDIQNEFTTFEMSYDESEVWNNYMISINLNYVKLSINGMQKKLHSRIIGL